MSSTLGETRTALHMLRVAVEKAPEGLIRGRTLEYVTDSQATANAINRMYSPVEDIMKVLLEIWNLVLRRGAALVATWVPRELNQEADNLSKLPDRSAWALNWHVYNGLKKHYYEAAGQRAPTLDAFADNGNNKCTMFLSRYLCEGSLLCGQRVQPRSAAGRKGQGRPEEAMPDERAIRRNGPHLAAHPGV